MTSLIDSTPLILPSSQTDTKSIFTIRKMVLADKDIHGSFVGQPTQPLVRIGALEVRLFIYEGLSPQYQLILTNWNGQLIWFSYTLPIRGWYTLTNILSQRDLVDSLLTHPYIYECIEELIYIQKNIEVPLPPGYIGSGTSNRASERHKDKSYCGDAIRRKISKWI
jgi:hypothetical protein